VNSGCVALLRAPQFLAELALPVKPNFFFVFDLGQRSLETVPPISVFALHSSAHFLFKFVLSCFPPASAKVPNPSSFLCTSISFNSETDMLSWFFFPPCSMFCCHHSSYNLGGALSALGLRVYLRLQEENRKTPPSMLQEHVTFEGFNPAAMWCCCLFPTDARPWPHVQGVRGPSDSFPPLRLS